MANPDLQDNPLLEIQFRIPFDRIRAEHAEPAIDKHIADAERAIDAIAEQPGALTYESTFQALDTVTERLEWAAGVIAHLESVATNPELRAAYEAVQPKLTRFSTNITLHAGLWKVLRNFAESPAVEALDRVLRRHVERVVDDFRRHGADLDESGKKQIAEYNVELAELTTKYSQHVLDSTNAFELIVEDEARLAGLPESAREAARESAQDKGKVGWRFTLQAPSLVAALTYLDDRKIREKIWRASNSRAMDPEFDNLPLVARILELRGVKAELLGYKDFADLALADRMATDGDTAQRFVDELREKTWDAWHKENDALNAFCIEHNHAPDGLKPWDLGYCAEKHRKAQFDFDEEELRPYFPVDQALRGLFQTIERLYGVVVNETDDLPVWDEAVHTYRIFSEHGAHLSSFYVDLYPRENKRDGAWMNPLITAVPPEPHLGLFCANATPPVGDKPALFTHREVETLFHEFGHLMHHCLSQVPVRSLAGINVAWDFVELPSQIMENWCWERQALDLFARHYKTGEPIPDNLFDKMLRTRTYRAANAQMRQIAFATVDLRLHREYDAAEDGDLVSYTREILQQHSAVPLLERYGFVASFSHVFSNPVGYAAAYYSYKWAEVLDADAFTRFREKGVFNRTVGTAFREAILSRGDSEEPMELYKSFMGREPQLEPLLERQGLLPS